MSLFNKDTKPAAAAPRRKAAPKASPVVITGLGLACHAGDETYALISSVLGQMSGVQISEEHKVKSNASGANVQTRMAPVEDIYDIRAYVRMHLLSAAALAKIEDQLSGNVDTDKLLIICVVNPDLITHNGKVDSIPLQKYLIEEVQGLESATFRILANNTSSSLNTLRACIAELNEGKWQAVIFGGADSLISIDACLKLNKEERLNTIEKTEGVVPGEAAAFFLLQNKDEADKHAMPILAYLRGVGVAAEPNARNADLEATEGLSNAIGQALTQAGIEASNIQGVVHNLGAETIQSLEWYQTTQAIWPRKVSEQQRIAVQNGEIEQAEIPDDPIPQTLLPYMTMGEVGAASLPMQLATALAWMEYDAWQARMGFPVRENILICDTPDAPERGALIMSTKLTEAA